VDQSVNCNWNEVDKKFASTAAAGGAKWDGTAGNGPLIDITTSLGSGGSLVDIATQAELNAHAAAADPAHSLSPQGRRHADWYDPSS